MCDSFSFAQEMPALDVSPTIPTMVLPGWGDKEEDQQVYFLPDMPANKKPDTARSSTNFTTDMDLGSLIAQDAFPSFILDVIEVGSVHAGTKARETRLARSQQSRSASDGAWQPYSKSSFTQRRTSLDVIPSRPPLNFAHTAPSDLPGSAPIMARGASLTTASTDAPSVLSKSQPPVLAFAPRRRSTVLTSSSERYRALRNPTTTTTCRPAMPLRSIPETPKDLDVLPEGSWALRNRSRGSSTLWRSRSAPNMKVSKRPIETERLKRSLSGSDKGEGSDLQKRYLSLALQMRRGSAPLCTYFAFRNAPVPPLPKTHTRSSSLVRSPRTQSLNEIAPTKAITIQNSLQSADIHWQPLAIRPKRSCSEPVPAITPRPETPTSSTMQDLGMMPDASAAPTPSGPPKSYQQIVCAEKKEEKNQVINAPSECAPPCFLTPNNDILDFSSLMTEREKEEEDVEDVWQAVAEAEKWAWPEPPSKCLTPRTSVTSLTNKPFQPEPIVYDNSNDTTPKASRSIYRVTNGADLSKIELRLDLVLMAKGEGKKLTSWTKSMRRKLRA
ncbi:hypothetical protein L804_03601 [Cryptococcus deuterogattii 2001/935-1]|nr:hypothetical protein L804_03601 [Cryptococcus deuterogattii 2001/935-1]